MTEVRYELVVAPVARRLLSEVLPKDVAAEAHAFIIGALLDDPQQAGKRLRPPLADLHSARSGTFRVIYRINVEQRTVEVLTVSQRAEATDAGRGREAQTEEP